MDPNETLNQLRYLARRLVECENPDPVDVQRMAELALALDEWLTKGGFLPMAWER